MTELFVGYRPVSKTTRKQMVAVSLCAALAGAGLAALLALSQQAFDPGTFEFGQAREFEGWLSLSPIPALRVPQPARPEQPPQFTRYPLVSFGKFGAPSELQSLDGKQVVLSGSLIYNNRLAMVELDADSWRAISSQEEAPATLPRSLGRVDLAGEIVDSKCFLGVMKPGRFKVHRDCAVRCISGGIPPLLLVQDEAGVQRHYFLVTPDLKPLNQRILDRVAEPVRVRGEVELYDNLLVLKAEPAAIER